MGCGRQTRYQHDSHPRSVEHARYKQGNTEEWIAIQEARSGAGFAGNAGQCDYLVINAWKSKGHQIIGHEIKTSKADWRRELDNPKKSERFSRYCNRWWVAMPADLAKQVEAEVPMSWGILAVTEKRCTQMRAAPLNENVEPVPLTWWVGWMASLSRLNDRSIQGRATEMAAAKIADADARVQTQVDRQTQDVRRRLASLEERLDEFRQETGLDIDDLSRSYNTRRLKAAVNLMEAAGHSGGLSAVAEAKKAIDALHEALTEAYSSARA